MPTAGSTLRRVPWGSFDGPNFTLLQARHLITQNPGLNEAGCADSPWSAPFTVRLQMESRLCPQGISWEVHTRDRHSGNLPLRAGFLCPARVCSKVAIILVSQQSSALQSKVEHCLEIPRKASALAPRCHFSGKAPLAPREGPCWGGWLTQLCCLPRRIPCALEAPKRQDATLSSSFHSLKLKSPTNNTEPRSLNEKSPRKISCYSNAHPMWLTRPVTVNTD